MSDDKAAGNSHNLQRPDVLVPPLRENMFPCRLPLQTFTGAPQAHS